MFNQRNVEDYFKKSFEFTGNKNWLLPTEAYKSPRWEINTLQQMKLELNKVKSQLSKFNLEKWSKHTRFRDPSSSIISTLKTKANIELLTQAWCKFYECLNKYRIIPLELDSLSSLHLCEAPGAFVSALNRFLYTRHRKLAWNWIANTLNPYYEGNPASDMIADDRLIRHTIFNWNFGADLTGDLMKYYNFEALTQGGPPVRLVTADGSVDCMHDPGEQENNVHFLHYCETMTALRVLEKSGSFVLKLFTMFEHGTICLMYLLACCFVKVHVFKPCSSKSGNSEVYVICLGYKGWDIIEPVWPSLIGPYKNGSHDNNTAMFRLSDISEEFLIQLEKCAKFFMDLQSATINENVACYVGGNGENNNTEEEINDLKFKVAECFMKKYRLAFHIPKRYKMMSFEKRKKLFEYENDFQDFKIIENLPHFNGSVENIKIGRALNTITASCFCQIKFISVPPYQILNKNKLDVFTEPFLLTNLNSTTKITHEQFSNFFQQQQYKYQKEFFNTVTSAVKNKSDIIIIAVPLLTRFLVGLIFILAQCYETVLVYKKGILLFRNAIKEKIILNEKYFKIIENSYEQADYEKRFHADILEIVPLNILQSENFYEIICRYNNEIFEQK